MFVFCDFLGRFIRVEISDKGTESDRNMYTNLDVYRVSDHFLCTGQHRMGDMYFAWKGALVVAYKKNQCTERMLRTCYNRHIKRQRMVKEWGIGFINNRFRICLERRPFEKDLFPMAYNKAVMLSNWQFDRRDFVLQPRSRYEVVLAAHARMDSDLD